MPASAPGGFYYAQLNWYWCTKSETKNCA